MTRTALADRDVVVYHGGPAARRAWLAVVAAGLLTLGTFILLPFSDLLAPPPRELVQLRPVSSTPPRPPLPPWREEAPLPAPPAVEPLVEPLPVPLDLPPAPLPEATPELPAVSLRLAAPSLPLDARLDFAVQVPPPAPPAPSSPAETAPPVESAAPASLVALPETPETVDRMPELLQSVEPVYPPRARRHDREGYVVLRFTVTVAGDTADFEVVDAVPRDLFVDAARQAVAKWLYRPAIKAGNPVPVRMQVRIRFKLE